MRVLVACEFSGIVREAFRKQGHDAWSCDLLPSEIPGQHIQDDVIEHLNDGWDLMIAHPPCTFITRAGTRWLYPNHKLNQERYKKGLEAKEFFKKLLNANIPMIAVENPAPHKVFNMPKETQVIQPFFFGCDVQKTTYLWLKNLPKLKSTNTLFKHKPPTFMRDSKGIRHSKWFMDCGFNAGKEKSKTFRGVAEAMATQWGSVSSKAQVPKKELLKTTNDDKISSFGCGSLKEKEGANTSSVPSKAQEHIGCEKERRESHTGKWRGVNREIPRMPEKSIPASPSQEPRVCFKCGKKLYYASGVGLYCANARCAALDYQPQDKKKRKKKGGRLPAHSSVCKHEKGCVEKDSYDQQCQLEKGHKGWHEVERREK